MPTPEIGVVVVAILAVGALGGGAYLALTVAARRID
jgi:hypothetical protein